MSDPTHTFIVTAIPKPGTKGSGDIASYESKKDIIVGYRKTLDYMRNCLSEVLDFIDEDECKPEDFNWSLGFLKLKPKPKPLSFMELLDVYENSEDRLKFHLVKEDTLEPTTDWYITFNTDNVMMRCRKDRPEDKLLDAMTTDGDLHLTFQQMTVDTWCIYEPEEGQSNDETKSED